MTNALFKKALERMVEDGEFDKIIASSTNAKERKKAVKDKEIIETALEIGLEKIPTISILRELECVDTLKDAISLMIFFEAKLLGEDKDGANRA